YEACGRRWYSRSQIVPHSVVTCPRCDKRLRVPDKMVGRWITCMACKMEFAAIIDDHVTLTPPVAGAMDDPSPAMSYQSSPTYTPSISPLVAGAVVGCVISVLAAIGAYASYRPAILWLEPNNTVCWVLSFIATVAWLCMEVMLMAWVAQDARCRGVDGGA